MDELLKNPPSQLADERTAMWALIDRFSAEIRAYKKQYASTVEKRDEDLLQRDAEKSDTLKKLKKSQENEERKAFRVHNAAIGIIDKQISDCQSKALKSVNELESRYAELETGEYVAMNSANNADKAKIKKYKEAGDHIKKVISNVDVLLGNTLKGERKIKSIVDSFDQPRISIQSKKEALEAVDHVWDEADHIYYEIKDITESLPKKVIFNGKMTALIENLYEMDLSAKEAIRWLETESRKEQQERLTKSSDRCARLRAECTRNKKSIINERDETVRILQDKRGEIIKEYQESAERMRSRHNREYAEQEKYFSTQIAGAAVQWQSELKKCNNTFVSHMEEVFPAKRMNSWLNQFWYHPQNVEDYNKVDFLQLNTLIGMAVVNISSWYRGETGTVIKQVLTNYIRLFGGNTDQAAKMYNEGKICLPFAISIEEGNSLLISYDDNCDDRAKAMLNAIGMRMLRTVPACQMRFQLIDANGIGAFGRLMSLDPARDNNNNPGEPTVKSIAIGEGEQVHSEKTDIAAQIAETKITLNDLSRQLTNYGSIREFNQENPLSKQIYRPILMMNFPIGLGETEIRTLNAMTTDCSKWGFSMVLAQPDKAINAVKPELQTLINELRKNVLCLRMESNSKPLHVAYSSSEAERHADILLYGLPDSSRISDIAQEIRRDSVEASKVLIRFTEAKGICPDRNQWFTRRADDGIVVPIGYIDGGQPFKLQFDDKHVNTIIMGNIGSGKTNLLHVLMTNIMLRYAPDEVMIYLIDFKYGLDFRMYTQYNLPNFRAISINNDPEFALAMIQNLEKETEERSSRMGSRYQKISEYNAANPNDRLNRVVLIVDELYELVKRADDEVQKSIIKKIDSFAHQQRAFGIHMVICGQDLDKIDHYETIKNQCSTRLALHCSDEQVKMLMDDTGVARMHTIDSNDQGACVFSLSKGLNPQIEHTTYLGAEQQEKVLGEIHKHYLEEKQITKVKILLTKVSDNPNHIVQMFVTNGHIAELRNNRLLVGEPISMERELNLCPMENIWVTGGIGGNRTDEALDAGNSLMFFSAVSLLLAKLKYNNLDIVCTNCNDHPMRDVEEEEKDLIGQLASTQSSLFKYNNGEKYRDVLNWMLEELDNRRNRTKSASKAVWWFLIRPEIITGLGDDSSLVIDLKELIQSGPQYNIHTILWNADIKKAKKMQIDRTLFKDRICLDMSGDDSKFVNGSELKPAPVGLKAVHIGNNTMKFRVYDLPDGKWMNNLFARLKDIFSKSMVSFD